MIGENLPVNDFIGLFKMYGEMLSPQVLKYLNESIPSLKRCDTVRGAVEEAIRNVPMMMRKPKDIEIIRRMGQQTEMQQEFRKLAQTAGPAATGMKGAATIGALGTIGAGAAATAAMAYPMKRLGERIGYGIEEKRAGRRLRPAAMPFGEVAAQLPGVQAMKRLYETPYKRFGGDVMSLKESAAKMKKEIQTPLEIGPSPRLKDFFSRAYGKIKSIRFKEAK